MSETEYHNRYSVLIVDDQETNLRILEDCISPLGYQIMKAANGREAIRQVALHRPDIILLDILMPEMDGHEVCRKLKESADYRDIPIVMVTALEGTEEMVKALENGADDFLTKPVNAVEITARIKSLLKKKSLNDKLRNAYEHINDLTSFAESELTRLTSNIYKREAVHINLVTKLLRIDGCDLDRPSHIFLGRRLKGKNLITGDLYLFEDRLNRKNVSFELDWELLLRYRYPVQSKGVLYFVEPGHEENRYNGLFGSIVKDHIGALRNFIICQSEEGDDVAVAFNYGKDITDNDADILKNFLLLSHVFSTISEQMDEVDKAFRYLVTALARAAEANDEETGNHIVRVNEYAGVIAEELELPGEFVRDISFFAQMHDVGKIHVNVDLLRKAGALTPEEVKMIREHTIYGAMILGDEPRLKMARDIALCHHERFDGGGYPRGLREMQIPLPARIVTIADVYDALRSQRTYKPAYSHGEAVEIITKGDDKTLPEHFDPKVLNAFIRREKDFERIYTRLADADDVRR